tara:strand:- start:1027 stop:1866 length:840 start_codon:yes stop_codon:yes gene_type:complete
MANKEISLQPSTIETVDLALFDLIKNKFALHTTTNAGWKQVPVLWISPERSFHVKNKEIRDKVGKLKLPLITVERSSFAKDPAFKGGFQANIFPDTDGARGYRKHVRKVARRISTEKTRDFASADAKRNTGDNHFPTDNKKVVYEEIYTPIPVWITSNYSITLRTEYQQQMNDLMTPFATRTGNINSLLIYDSGHQYEAFIQQDFAQSNNMANLGEEERMFQTKIDIKVLGYLLGDGKNEEVPKIIIKETTVEIKLIRERSIVGDEKPWKTDNKKYREF